MESRQNIVLQSQANSQANFLQLYELSQALKPTQRPDPRAFVDGNDLLQWPEPSWIIDGIMPENGLGMVFGLPGSLKTFLSLEMVLSIAHGLPFLGKWAVKESPIAYVTPEGTSGLKRRVQAWMQENEVKTLRNTLFNRHAFALNDSDETKAIINHVTTSGLKPRVLVIDTLARNFSGDENSTKEMSALVNNVMEIVQAKEMTVLFVHHSGKDASKGARGSIALTGAVDFSIEMQRTAGESSAKVLCRKQKDAEEFKPFVVNAVNVGKSLVLKYSDDEPLFDTKPVVVDMRPILIACRDEAKRRAEIEKAVGGSTTTTNRHLLHCTKAGYVEKFEGYPARYITTDKGKGWLLTSEVVS